MTATALYDESAALVAISTTERDVTESRRMERQMGRLAAIVASSADAVVAQTLEGVITRLEYWGRANLWLHRGGDRGPARLAAVALRTA